MLAQIDGMETPEQVRAAMPALISVRRAQLPNVENAFYHTDLMDKAVIDHHGIQIGRVVRVHDFGAGALLEIVDAARNHSFLLPFRKSLVPDVAADHIVLAADAHIYRNLDQTPPDIPPAVSSKGRP